MPIELKVKRMPPDDWGRPRLKNVESGRIYVDISIGRIEHQPVKYNVPGAWHTVSGPNDEPDCPLKKDVFFILEVENAG
jgi:hypothetical protein